MRIYMATTNDELELPCFISERAKDVAKFVGMTVGSFYTAISKHQEASNHFGYHIYKVEITE